MTFAHPLALLLGLLAVPLVLLYRLHGRVHRETVATGFLWDQVLAQDEMRLRWQPLRNKLSLAIHLAVLTLVVLAAAEPQIPPPRRIVLVVDNSASMEATDVSPSRLAVAKETALRLVKSLRACDEMAVLCCGVVPGVSSTPTSDPASLRAAIESIGETHGPSKMFDTLALARDLVAAARGSRRIVVITDGCFPEAGRLNKEEGVEVLRVGTAAGNTAITRWAARRSIADPRVCRIQVEVRSVGRSAESKSAPCRLTIALDGAPIDTIEVRFDKDDRWRKFFDMATPKGGRLTAKLEPADDYPADNEASIDVPPAGMIRVAVPDEASPCLQNALKANPLVELVDADAADCIHVLDGKLPQTLPAGPVLVFNPTSCDLWKCGDAVADPSVARLSDDSPVTRGVRLIDVYLPEARRLEPVEAVRSMAKPLAWSADGTPLALSIQRPQGRVVVLGGNLAAGNLAMQTAFPLLVTNALDWLAGQRTRAEEFAGAGIVTARPEESSGEEIGAVDLRVPAALGVDAAAASFGWPVPPAWIYLLGLAVAILAVEWCLYQRRWIS